MKLLSRLSAIFGKSPQAISALPSPKVLEPKWHSDAHRRDESFLQIETEDHGFNKDDADDDSDG